MAEVSNKLQVTMIPLDRLRPSPTQPRKRFDQDKQNELTESMRQHGFTMSALLVRRWPGDEGKNGDSAFEIVAGERRSRSAREAGLLEAPCFVRNLTDYEVIELQLIENLQREDLTPIEEAEGFRAALALVDPATKEKAYTVESLAKKVGKSERSIFERLSLCKLDSSLKKDVETGTVSAKMAHLISRIPDVKSRKTFADKVLRPQYRDQPLSTREAELLLHNEFVRDLRAVAFKPEDATLVPVEKDPDGARVAGGACTDCPMRSGATESKGRGGKNTMCLNPSCYERKAAAEYEQWRARETDKGKERVALSQKESSKLFQYGNQVSSSSGLVDLDEHPDGYELKPGKQSPGKWRKLVIGANVPVFVARDRFGKTRELVKRELAIEAARTINKIDAFKTSTREKPKTEEQRKEEERKRECDREKDQAVIEAISQEISKHKGLVALGTMRNFLAYIVDRELDATGVDDHFIKRYKLASVGNYGDWTKQLEKRYSAELVAMMMDLIISESSMYNDGILPDDRKRLKSIFDIDVKTIEKTVAAQFANEKKPAGEKKAKKK